MKTFITQKLEAKKMLLTVIFAGYVIIAVFAVLRVLTDISEWWKARKKTS